MPEALAGFWCEHQNLLRSYRAEKQRSPSFLSQNATGYRTIIYEGNTLPKIQKNPTIDSLLPRSAVLLLDPEATYFGKGLRSQTDLKIKIVYDCEHWQEGIEDIMAITDYFIPSSDFFKSEELHFEGLSFEERIFRLKTMVRGDLVVTDGENGAHYIMNDNLYQVLPPRINIADTIGAGDNFHAAFALALSKGSDLLGAVKFSVAVASLSCREYGGRKGIPGWTEAIDTADSLKSIRL